jgi:long-chain acyl-CoA synthetase
MELKGAAEVMAELGFWRWAESDPTRRAIIDPNGAIVSYEELTKLANALLHGLRSAGCEYGDTIAVMLPNSVEMITAYLAAIQGGLYVVFLNYHLKPDEVAYVLSDSEAVIFIASSRYGDVARSAADDANISQAARFAVGGEITGFRDYTDLVAGQSSERPADIRPGDRMQYTSGTTGRPKGVRRALDAGTVDEVAARPGIGGIFGLVPGEGIHLVAGPMYHSAPTSVASLALNYGNTIVLMDKWDPEENLRLIEKYRVTHSHMVPTMFHRLFRLPAKVKDSYDVSSLKTVVHGAAPISAELKREMISWWGPVLYEYFGSTEMSGTGVNSEDWLRHVGTVGKPWPGVELRIVDESGQECPPNAPGRIYMRSVYRKLFEYYKSPEKTAESRLGDFVTVGDIGYLDDDGWLYACDRSANVVISGGVNIYPVEVEMILGSHPGVADAAVFGVPNEEWGEEVKAVVQLDAAHKPSATLEKELIAYCRQRLAHYKCPRTVEFRTSLPRDNNGKLYKRLIRSEYWPDRADARGAGVPERKG